MHKFSIETNPEAVNRSGKWFVIFPDVMGAGAAIEEIVSQAGNVVVIVKPRWLSTTPLSGCNTCFFIILYSSFFYYRVIQRVRGTCNQQITESLLCRE
jgi:hypothetical protein